ncbi:hypothetical protein C8Q72DRAFT_851442 [Fomitopsis betulina]|nr:hypothetical protein C8Q72DRAFT_851442 [Fomitopsis betulina]
MPTKDIIPKPCPFPATWGGFYEATRMTVPAFQQLRAQVDRLARKHLDLSRSLTHQDKHCLRRCLVELTACWPDKGNYENDWPIHMALRQYLSYKSCHGLGHKTWRFQIPGTRKKPVRKVKQKRVLEKKPKFAPLLRRTHPVKPSARRDIQRTFLSKRVRPPSHTTSTTRVSRPSTASTPVAHSATSASPRSRVRCQVGRPVAAPASRAQTPAPVLPARMHRCPLPTRDPQAVRSWFAAINPRLPDIYAEQLINLGIVNGERLHQLARLPWRDRWINEYIPNLDRYEYWVIRRALDEMSD